jgi:release factor glutamine methyltransferase
VSPLAAAGPFPSRVGPAVRQASLLLAEAGISAARLEADLLVGAACGASRAWLRAHASATLPPGAASRLEAMLARRAAREPLQYILGEQEFRSLRFQVDPRVLIPRPETELLVEEALRRAPAGACRIADIGTGSGCVAIALAAERPDAIVVATDRSAAALEVARANAARLLPDRPLRFLHGDLLAPVASDPPFDLIVSNPPYIASLEFPGLSPEVNAHEPSTALVGGETGLEVIGALVVGAPPRLAPGGWLLLEIGAGQWPEVRSRVASDPRYVWSECVPDFQGIPRIVAARVAGGQVR